MPSQGLTSFPVQPSLSITSKMPCGFERNKWGSFPIRWIYHGFVVCGWCTRIEASHINFPIKTTPGTQTWRILKFANQNIPHPPWTNTFRDEADPLPPPAADAPMRRPARPNGDGPWAPLGRCQSSGPPAEASAPPGANWARPREGLLSGAPQNAWPFFKVAKTRGSLKRVLKKGVPHEFHAKMSTNLAKTQVPTTMNARQTRKV